jgi:hypothetical protein
MKPHDRTMFPKKERGRKYTLNLMLSFKVGWKKCADKIGNKEKTIAPKIIAPSTRNFRTNVSPNYKKQTYLYDTLYK